MVKRIMTVSVDMVEKDFRRKEVAAREPGNSSPTDRTGEDVRRKTGTVCGLHHSVLLTCVTCDAHSKMFHAHATLFNGKWK